MGPVLGSPSINTEILKCKTEAEVSVSELYHMRKTKCLLLVWEIKLGHEARIESNL